jgi:F0F1-type ATP synthase assembly protein I
MEPAGSTGGPSRPPYEFLGLGFEIAAPLVLFMCAGYLLDGWAGSRPWLTIVGAIVGIAVGLYYLFRRFLPPRGGGSGP